MHTHLLSLQWYSYELMSWYHDTMNICWCSLPSYSSPPSVNRSFQLSLKLYVLIILDMYGPCLSLKDEDTEGFILLELMPGLRLS